MALGIGSVPTGGVSVALVAKVTLVTPIGDGNAQSIPIENVVADSGAGTSAMAAVEQTKKTNNKAPRKKTSKVRKHFIASKVEKKEDNKVMVTTMAKCNYYKVVLCADSTQGTTRLWNHYNSQHGKYMNQATLQFT